MANKTHQRNTAGIRRYARDRHEAARHKCKQAITILLSERKNVNFKTVSEAANVSLSWLYKQKEVREQIEFLRSQKKSKIAVPATERASSASQIAQNKALRKRISELEGEIKKLREQNEVAYGIIAHNNLTVPETDIF